MLSLRLINYPEWRQHEARAFVEMLERTGKGYRVLGVGPRTVIRDPAAILRVLTDAHQPSGHRPFGGASNEDVAIQLLLP